MAENDESNPIILDSSLNPHKAQLLHTGFFPYRGLTYDMERDGALPLHAGMHLDATGNGRQVRIAHGLYPLPARAQEAAISVAAVGLHVDLGSAILRGDEAPFASYGEHLTYGTGLLVEGSSRDLHGLGAPLRATTVQGGILSGYFYGLQAREATGVELDGITVVDGRRIQSDATRPISDNLRGFWLNFWLTPADDATEEILFWERQADSYGAYGAGIALRQCANGRVTRSMIAHTTVGIADYEGRSNHYEGNDFSECPMGLRFWHSGGIEGDPIRVVSNTCHFNTQPVPWWWSGGDGAAILGAGIHDIEIAYNDLAFGGDGIFLCGLPFPPGTVQQVRIHDNLVRHSFAHGIELDFVQDAIVWHNDIHDNWLSGIWAGHAILAIQGNTFRRNNSGRAMSGWIADQGAISCPEGRLTVVGNRFEEQVGCAINLRADHWTPGWAFSGDSAGHIVVGNEFVENGIAVYMRGILDSQIAHNRLERNEQDFLMDDSCQGNDLSANGPFVKVEDAPAVIHCSHHRILFSALEPTAHVSLLRLSPDGIQPLAPTRITVSYVGAPWLDATPATSGYVALSPYDLKPASRSARLTLSAKGARRTVSLKYWAVQQEARFSAVSCPNPTSAHVTPTSLWGARFGLFNPLSITLRGGPAFSGQQEFCASWTSTQDVAIPPGRQEMLLSVLSDGLAALSILPAPVAVDQRARYVFRSAQAYGWPEWQSAHFVPDTNPLRLRYDYLHEVAPDQKGICECVTGFMLVALDETDAELLARRHLSLTREGRGWNIWSYPGLHRRIPRP
jgi:hypothetical protein